MGRIVIVAVMLATVAAHAAFGAALPPPVRRCGTIPRRVPLRPARLEIVGGEGLTSCRTARRVMLRFRRTFADDVLGWRCTASHTEDDGTFVLGSCTRTTRASGRETIEAYVPGPVRDD